MFSIKEKHIIKLFATKSGSEKCMFVPTKELIIKMINAVIFLKGKSDREILERFAF